MSHFNNNPRDRGRINQIPVRDNYYNNVPPVNMYDNSQERCLFTNGNNQFNNVTQNNNVKFDNSLKSDNRGRFLHEQDYVNKPLLDNNLFEEVRNEYIDEKDIIIDTMDRDIELYPNIFDFRVKLGSTDTTPGPAIHRSVENVKYLKLIKAVFPDNYRLKKSTDIKAVAGEAGVNQTTLITSYLDSQTALTVYNGTTLFDDKYTDTNTLYIIDWTYPKEVHASTTDAGIVEIQRIIGTSVGFDQASKTFSFNSGSQTQEGGVTIQTGSGFNSLNEFVTAFQNHNNYSNLPYIIENINNYLTLTFKTSASQEIRLLEKHGDHPTALTVFREANAPTYKYNLERPGGNQDTNIFTSNSSKTITINSDATTNNIFTIEFNYKWEGMQKLLYTGDIIRIENTNNYNYYQKITSYQLVQTDLNDETTKVFKYTCHNVNITTGTADETTVGTKITKFISPIQQDDFIIDFFYQTSTTDDIPNYSTVYSAHVATIATTGNTIKNLYAYTQDTNAEFQIEKGRFYQLHIDQLPKNNDLSTNQSVRNSFSILYPGKEDERGFNVLDGMETDKIFRFSNLGTFNTMNIKILNCAGDVISNNSNYWSNMLSTNDRKQSKNIINVHADTKDEYPASFRSASKYLRHPLSWKLQSHFIFTVGEVRIEMNKRTFN